MIINPSLLKKYIYIESALKKLENCIYIHGIFFWSLGNFWKEAWKLGNSGELPGKPLSFWQGFRFKR